MGQREQQLAPRRTFKRMNGNGTVDLDPAEVLTLEAWTERAKALFGDDPLYWQFECPKCKNVASVADYKNAGADDPCEAYQYCIGNYTASSVECDWKSFGLFGTLGNGQWVEHPEGTVRDIFQFAVGVPA